MRKQHSVNVINLPKLTTMQYRLSCIALLLRFTE